MCVYDLDAAYDGSSNDDDDNNKSLLDSRSENTAAPPVWPPQDQHLLSSPPFQQRSTPLQPNTTFPLNFLPKDLQQIYRRGLIPCVTEWFQAEEEHGLLDPAYRWRGLLPLGPAVQFPTIKGSVPLRQRRQSKSTNRQLSRQRGQTRIRPRPSPFRQTIHAFSPQQDSECESALVCLMKILLLMTTNDLLRVLFFCAEIARATYFTCYRIQCLTITSFFGYQADEVVPSADAKSRRRPPMAGSTSISPQAASIIAQKAKADTEQQNTNKTETASDVVHVYTPGVDRAALKELPALRDGPPTKREELFVAKLKLCSVIFSFDDPTADKRGKDMKRQTLLELVDFVNTPAGQKVFTESVMGDLMAMVSANVCRALPPATDDFDPEEDEPVLEPAWPHLQVAYEFFLRFIVSSEVNAKAAKKYVDQKFCLQLVELFDSEDPRERDYLKTILHRIYGKFMSHRSFIRRAISNVFYRFVYETERHNGIGELLEILGSIINGFAIPLKKEHLQFLARALIPLHKPKCVALYHQQLSYCIIQYVEKDADTATPILNGFFKCWPWSNSGKQVMFLNELEEILELLGADQLAQVSTMLFTNLARCLDSDHFQVVERALFLWNNEHLVNSGCLSRLNAQTVLPIIYGPLYKNSSGHWNATVEGLAQNVLKMYMEYDLALYDRCTAAYFREEEEAKKKLEALQDKWALIEKEANSIAPALLLAK
jgi:serine/threonine-protein phosphatase 2A regulatory subunit B'